MLGTAIAMQVLRLLPVVALVSTRRPQRFLPRAPCLQPRRLQRRTAVFGSRAVDRCSRPARSDRRTALHASVQPAAVGPRIAIDEDFPGLVKVHADPDVFVIQNFLDDEACSDIIRRANEKTMRQSPVAYAGWTQDVADLVELAAKGPVVWLAIVAAWLQVRDSADANNTALVVHALQNYALLLVVAVLGIAAFTKSRADSLQQLRTSTSTTLDDLDEPSSGTLRFVRQSAKLFCQDNALRQVQASLFEAPTVIRYQAGQSLAPHFDANRSAETEDANRGGQTLATLLVYLNDVREGGLTRFGKLAAVAGVSEPGETALTIRPKRGDALLFFPADAAGRFDERTEHEGCPAVDEKWIARIWRHESRVPPPYGLNEDALSNV